MKNRLWKIGTAFLLCAALVAALLPAAVAGAAETAPIAMPQKTVYLVKGRKITVKAAVSPSQKLTWSSANKSIATVSGGKIAAKKVGKTTVAVRAANGSKTSIKVVVAAKATPTKKVALTKPPASMQAGTSATLKAAISPSSATGAVLAWTSGNSSVAKVDAAGRITALQAGTAKITAKAGGKSASCMITVTAPAPLPTPNPGGTVNPGAPSSGSEVSLPDSGTAPASGQLSAPSGLRTTVQSYNEIRLDWNTVAGAAMYRIYLSTSAGSGYSSIGEVGNNFCYVYPLPSPNTTYYFRVSAIDAYGREGIPCAFVPGQTLGAPTAPRAPGYKIDSMTDLGNGNVAIVFARDWGVLTSGYTAFKQYYSLNGGVTWISAPDDTCTVADGIDDPSFRFWIEVPRGSTVCSKWTALNGPSESTTPYTIMNYAALLNATTMNGTVDRANPVFTWTSVPGAQGYLIYKRNASLAPNFSNPLQGFTYVGYQTGTSYTITSATFPGTYMFGASCTLLVIASNGDVVNRSYVASPFYKYAYSTVS